MKKRILLIEDDVTLRTEIATILSLEDFEVKEAPNGEIGLSIAEEFLPDLVLCDIMMPVMDGTEVLSRIRSSRFNQLTEFIFITALAERENVRMGMEKGADDYLVKPFTREELLRAINSRIGIAARREEKAETNMNELREKILTLVPHEMRTPLHAIIGFSQIIKEEATRSGLTRIADLACYIQGSGQQLLKLTNRYNKYVEAQATVKKEGETDIYINTVKLITDTAKAIAVIFNREDDLNISLENSVVMISEDKLKTIISELVDNAFKFSHAGTPVNISGEIVGNMYVITIADAGRGIEREDIKKIGAFQQFERKQYEQQGSGLGLITSRLIIELAGGSLAIDSEPGEGTAIQVFLQIPIPD